MKGESEPHSARDRLNEAQEQKIAQCVLLEALAQLAEPGCGPLVEHSTYCRPRDQKQDRGDLARRPLHRRDGRADPSAPHGRGALH